MSNIKKYYFFRKKFEIYLEIVYESRGSAKV